MDSDVRPGIEREKKETKEEVVIVVLGRGVGQNPVTGKLEPTDYLEAAVVKDPTKGHFGPEQHPVENVRVDVDREPPESRYAGGEANVEATGEIAKAILADKTQKLVGICFAAGRTPDMKEYAPEGWTQGMVMAKAFLKKYPEIAQSGVRMIFEPDNVNTRDDLAVSLLWAQNQGCKKVILTTVGVHMKRTYLMTQELLEGMRREFGKEKVPEVKYVTSETLVMRKGKMERKKIRQVMESQGHNKTLDREIFGVAQMRKGTYQSQWFDVGKVREFNKPVREMTVEEVVNFR